MKKSIARNFAHKKLKEWGLSPKWSFEFDTAKRRFGCCKPRYKKITLSAHLTRLNDQDEVFDTILHEIAHALDYEDRGRSDHSHHWKKWARKVGAKPTRCYDGEKVNNTYKYFYYCPQCGTKSGRHRRVRRKTLCSCNNCSKSFDTDYLLIPNVPARKMEQIEAGDLHWARTQAATIIMDKLVQSWHDEQDSQVWKEYAQAKKEQTTKKPKIAAKTKSKGSSSTQNLSNKAIVYKAWQKEILSDKADPKKLHELVDKRVKLSTIKGWLSGWRNGRNLPAIAKSD